MYVLLVNSMSFFKISNKLIQNMTYETLSPLWTRLNRWKKIWVTRRPSVDRWLKRWQKRKSTKIIDKRILYTASETMLCLHPPRMTLLWTCDPTCSDCGVSSTTDGPSVSLGEQHAPVFWTNACQMEQQRAQILNGPQGVWGYINVSLSQQNRIHLVNPASPL